MEPKDYKKWVAFQRDLDIKRHAGGHRATKLKTEEEEAIEDQLFEAVSKRAWTDMLLQLLKVRLLDCDGFKTSSADQSFWGFT